MSLDTLLIVAIILLAAFCWDLTKDLKWLKLRFVDLTVFDLQASTNLKEASERIRELEERLEAAEALKMNEHPQ